MVLGCTSEKVSWDTQEDSRRQAKENSEFNARKFRQLNTKYSQYRLVLRGDSTIGKNCAQGDGWASVDLEDGNGTGTGKVELKCSTVSDTIGCMTKADFMKKAHANEEGTCNENIPVPLPKIKK